MGNEEPSHSELLRSRWNDFRSRCYTNYPDLFPDKTFDIALRTKFKEREEERKRKFKNHEMSKDEVLHYLRGEREMEHRGHLQFSFDYCTFCWSSKTQGPCLDKTARFRRARALPQYTSPSYLHDLSMLSNKSVPLYVLTSSRLGEHNSINKVQDCLRKSLCCYLYDKWFYPYYSNIEFDQFITKIIVPTDLECCDTTPSSLLIDNIVNINKDIVSYLETAKKDIVKGVEEHLRGGEDHRLPPRLARSSWEGQDDPETPGRMTHHYSVPALFKSLGIILCTEAWGKDGPSEIGNTPVCMFLTGEDIRDCGLSASITFDTIEDKIQAVLQRGPKKAVQTTLNTAVDFVMELERREASARSPPDPLSRTYYPKPKFPGAYNHFFEGMTEWGPSSEWIDGNDYQEWTGPGANADLHYYTMEEDERVISRMLKKKTSL